MADDQREVLERRVRQVIADVLAVDVSEVTSGGELAKEWESIQALNIAMSVEQEFGIQLSAEELGKMSDLASIVAILTARS
jgi:acyl carrier protein